jgi:transposase
MPCVRRLRLTTAGLAFPSDHTPCHQSADRDAVDPAALAEQVTRYRSAALIAISQTRGRPGALARKHHAPAGRLLGRQDDYLRFTQDWEISPDSNGTERDIRMAKLRQKVSGCLRTHTGCPPVLRDPQLPIHRRQTRPQLLRRPCHAHRRPALDARHRMMPG